MDTFMDKLAQKFTAQEIIKANTAADTEELKRLRGQIKQYNDCLAQMQEVNQELRTVNDQLGRLVSEEITPEIHRLVESGVLKLEDARVDTTEIDRLVQESCDQIKKISEESNAQLQKVAEESNARLQKFAGDSNTQLQKIAGESNFQLQKITEKSDAQLQKIAEDSNAQLQKFAEESNAQLQKVANESSRKIRELQQNGLNMDEIKQVLDEKADASNDYVHRECVKVYRNVQAVVAEESNKQLEGVNDISRSLKGRMDKVMLLAAGALAVSVAGMVLQILSLLHVF
ncbi:MAG: hypothetical protein J6C84_10215 [Lachnospiraceae bacterium]|nr:hypothetical protein [Lachnospiraceae bacterium]